MGEENEKEKVTDSAGNGSGSSSPIKSSSPRASSVSHSTDDDLGLPTCRVCQCVESDKTGDSALGFLGINPPTIKDQIDPESNVAVQTHKQEPDYVEFISPNGEVFVCNTDLEMGACHNRDTLIELGCSCKNDLALVHYGCALKWFVSHGSTVCEICGCVAANISYDDFTKVLASLKEYEVLRDRTANGAPNPAQVHDNSGVDPDAVAAIRRLRLSEIHLWFNPLNNNQHINGNSENTHVTELVVSEQPSNIVIEDVTPPEHPATRWAVEGTGILLATGLLTVTLVWLIAPRVGKVISVCAYNCHESGLTSPLKVMSGSFWLGLKQKIPSAISNSCFGLFRGSGHFGLFLRGSISGCLGSV